jgi:hypothetical protein
MQYLWRRQRQEVFNNAIEQAGYQLTLDEINKLNALIDEHFQGKLGSEQDVRDFEWKWELECYK